MALDGVPRLQVQGGRAHPGGGRRPCHAAREAAGDDFIITIDANQGYRLPMALELCARVADLDIRWFEEPCRWANDRATCARSAPAAASRCVRARASTRPRRAVI